MVFSSAIFLFAFLPVLYIVYRLLPGIRAKNAVLLLFSLIFYCFGSLQALPVLLFSILLNWGAGRLLGRLADKKRRRRLAGLIVTVNAALLIIFKYAGFLAENLNALLGTSLSVPALTLPLGISFFTFTGLSYVIEVSRRPERMERNIVKTALYIALFPNILSGPILSWNTAAPQLSDRVCTPEKTARGLRRFIVGMAKKLLIADVVAKIVTAVYGSAVMDARLAWLGAVGYAVQVYFDFSGYSDMALGLAGVFGFSFPENFNYPYTALDLTDYWRRWHISLTTWFRSYVYMPMVMSRPLRALYSRQSAKYGRARANKLSILLPSAVVWVLTGLWHGPSWTYILWGVWNGLFCVLEGVGLLRTDGLKKTFGGRVLLRVYMALVVLTGAVLFRAESLSQAGGMLAALFTGFHFTPAATLVLQQCLSAFTVTGLAAGLVGSAAILPWLRARSGRWGEPASYALCLGLLVLCIMNMAANGFQPFIYLQF